jgi:hypothetical protein
MKMFTICRVCGKTLEHNKTNFSETLAEHFRRYHKAEFKEAHDLTNIIYRAHNALSDLTGTSDPTFFKVP